MEAKEVLRKRFKSDRIALGEKERAIRSEKIARQCINFLNQQEKIRHIHLFFPIKKLFEINTVLLLPQLLDAGYKVYGSITDRKMQRLNTVKINEDTVFQEDEMGIPVPGNPKSAPNESIELVFVPLLGVDTKGNRLGYGMGYYDRFFLELKPDVLKVGLSYFAPKEELPRAEHDVPLDACVFPEGSVIFKQ
ncbi:5-formyltetrahydrofolate cyclo-ligase [Cyclobacterium jeungdonense]|uniref:5-formyltetrahydrofolate cyclo-ligase n=1 Tax=Cyclobacterium jeungdonense TaxID=708087 RepID=A0ABT8CA70_9BACT|nr:5-formyltetrahydrofolate cyclo-ligase [Cyclobacterium jeungdonense]MDN3689695.1 5-formyltetrahydrofolate cyclo-ligase [Cyclobacterium jeungdonense]